MAVRDQLAQVKQMLADDIAEVRETAKQAWINEVYNLHGWILTKYFSRSGPGLSGGLRANTGTARRGWKVNIDRSGGGVRAQIINEVSYVTSHLKDRVVKPGPGKKWLAIPSENAKTKGGANRYSGPKDPKAPKMTFIQRKGDSETAFLIAKPKQGIPKKRALLFILKKRVFIPGRLATLIPRANQQASQINRKVLNTMTGVG